GNKEAILLMHFVKAVDAGGRLLGNAAPIFHDLMPAVRILALDFEQQIFDHLFFLVRGFGLCPIAAFLEFVTFVDEQRGVAAIIDHELWALAVRMRDRLVSAPPIFLEAFAFRWSNCRCFHRIISSRSTADFRSTSALKGILRSRNSREGTLVDCLEKSETKLSMYFHCGGDDGMTLWIFLHVRSV